MIMTEKEIKSIIESRVRYWLTERDVLKLPNSAPPVDPNMGMDANAVPLEDPNAMPPTDPNGEPPADPNMDANSAAQPEDPNMTALMDLLAQNPDRVEGVYKYAKGIIGNDVAPAEDGEESMGDDVPPAGDAGAEGNMGVMPESRQIQLDELVNDILGIKEKKKPTIDKPIGRGYSMKNKMFRPVMGF